MVRLHGRFEHSARRLVGAALLVLAVVLLGFTERADRLRAMAQNALGGFVLTGTSATPGPASNGRLALVAGAPEIKIPARDSQFGVTAQAPALLRKVEMFQWYQTGYGEQRGYGLAWFDHPIDSTTFGDSTGHANPGAFPVGATRFDASDVRIEGFTLAPGLIRKIQGPQPFDPDLSHLPPNMAATFQAKDGALVTSVDPGHPQVGDLRIRWMRIAPRQLTVLARVRHGRLVITRNAAGDAITQVMLGRHSLTDMLSDAPQPPRFRWARRVLALLLAWAGIAWLLPRAWQREPGLSLSLAVVPLAALAATAWWGVRMPAAIVLVFVALAGASVAGWRWQRGRGAAPSC